MWQLLASSQSSGGIAPPSFSRPVVAAVVAEGEKEEGVWCARFSKKMAEMFHTRPQVPGPGQLMALHVLQLVGKALEASVASRSPTRELSTRGAPTNQGMLFLLLRRS